ncbi:MAG: hypothetical protein RMJ98_17125 [Myxococcales bacterium]|nr:acyl-protein synthetase [Polyangiaceae bacterium]MDW8251019.1 hypothetical protein [Myxococcales bacterium]
MSPALRSEQLHARVRAAMDAPLDLPLPSFDALACDLARYQAASCPAIARLFRARGVDPATLRLASEIPAVPTEVFKMTRVAAHEPSQDAVVFRTSGTTAGARGNHHLRSTLTYRYGALRMGERMLIPDRPEGLRTLLLMSPTEEAPDSSLGFMAAAFAQAWADGGQWFLRGGSLDVAGLKQAVAEAREARAPVLLLATSFALVYLLDALAGKALPLPPGSRVMQTGGYKGRSREVPADELRVLAASTLALDPRAVVSEYGMTELCSQAYEGTLRGLLGLDGATQEGVLATPPWMQITPVDPDTLRPVPPGHEGIARITDLANVDSAVVIQTQDRIRQVEGGFVLLGRLSGAPLRGCSLTVEEMLGGGP